MALNPVISFPIRRVELTKRSTSIKERMNGYGRIIAAVIKKKPGISGIESGAKEKLKSTADGLAEDKTRSDN